MNYDTFLDAKAQAGADSGFEPVWMPSFLFDFQADMVDWAIRKGRAAIFADCGLGKTPMGLTWASNVVRKTDRPVLYLTPLAVAGQTIRIARLQGRSRMTQLGLELVPRSHPPLARKNDPVESHQAAASAKQLQADHHCLILGALRRGAAGKDRIASITRLSGTQVARRTTELYRSGAIKPTGRTVTSASGRQEREWYLVVAPIGPMHA